VPTTPCLCDALIHHPSTICHSTSFSP
jgi:hypothetical protein